MTISVIIAVYNVEKYLEACIKSLINQDFRETEFILVDDGSTDKSSQICDIWKSLDTRIKVIHKTNGGLSDARNTGLNIAKGQYVMFLDGDDVLDRNTLRILSNIVGLTNSDFIQYAYREANSPDLTAVATFDGKFERITDRHEMFLRLYRLGGSAASGCTKLINRKLFDHIKFPKGKLHEDEFFTTELLSIVESVTYITNFIPYQYIIHPKSIITSGFNPRRVYDLSQMYSTRICKLSNMGYSDLSGLFRTRYFSNLYFQYISSRNAHEKECTNFIETQIKALSKFITIDTGFELKIVKFRPKLLLPLLYLVRRLLNKHILRNNGI